MAKKKKLTISFSIADDKIVGATIEDVVLQAGFWIDDVDDSYEVCLLYIEKAMCMKMMAEWIELKTGICIINDHFCGQGWGWLTKYKEIKQDMSLNLISSEVEHGYVETKVRSFRCLEYGMEIEHG